MISHSIKEFRVNLASQYAREIRYKHRKQNQLVDVCMNCNGTGKAKDENKKEVVCWNCNGKRYNVLWVKSDAHRHQASMRYMVKMFLMELWVSWRKLEGLDTRAPYAEEYLGRKHHDSYSDSDHPSMSL